MRKLGSVDDKNSHLDFHALEQQRGITIYSKQAAIECRGAELTLLDTPGHVDFSSEAERTLQVLDYAVLVIDANDGVRGHTETLWRLLERHGVPTFVFANKMDLSLRTHADVMDELSCRLSETCVDFSELQIGEDESERPQAGASPESSPSHAGASPESSPSRTILSPELAEACASADEQAIEEFLDTGTLTMATLRRLVAKRSVFPVFFGSALKMEGVDEFLNAIANLIDENRYPDEFAARVFKISHDPAGVRLTWLKVTGGTLKAKRPVQDADGAMSSAEKVNQIRRYSGEKHEVVPACSAGEICAVTGLARTCPGMELRKPDSLTRDAPHDSGRSATSLCERDTKHAAARIGRGIGPDAASIRKRNIDLAKPVLVPTFACGVILNGCDVQTVHSALNLLTDEDPLLNVQWNERLQELQVQIMGAIQLEVLQATLLDRFGLNVDFGPGGVLYRETIEEPVVGVGHFEPLRHYAEVHLLIEPLPLGSGVQFGTRCHVDKLDLNWQRLILTNAKEREHLGVLTGSPLTDVRIALIGGRAHNKHTEGGDFRQATYRAIRQGLMQAKSVLLEPWNKFSLRVPTDQVGRAFSDLQRMGARYDAPQTTGDFTTVEGVVPAKEISNYAMQLNSYTHGMGSLGLEFSGYERCHDEQDVIQNAAYDPEADLPNTPDSVFCSHGAGHTVKWSDVPAMAHVKPDPATFAPWREATPEFFGR